MLILAAATTLPTTAPVNADSLALELDFFITIGLGIVGLVLAIVRFRVFIPSKVAGPSRLPWPLAVWPLWVAVGLSIVSIFAASMFISAISPPHFEKQPGETEMTLSDADQAVYSAAPPVMSLLVVLALLNVMQPGTISAIGLSRRSVSKWILTGFLAALIIIPWINLFGVALEQIYQATGVHHPAEHELLKVMNTPKTWVKWLAILGAAIIAPVWEELFFRGLFQTALTEGLLRLVRLRTPISEATSPALLLGGPATTVIPAAALNPKSTSGGIASSPVAAAVPLAFDLAHLAPLQPPTAIPPSLTYLPTSLPPIAYPPQKRHWAAWISILITSCFFAILHPLWTAPIIFLLAVGLGYVYERTGKLWVSMTVHATFNILSTLFYLLLLH